MEWAVEDYNYLHHTVHNILSFNEVSAVTDTYDYQSILNRGMTNRWMVNSKFACIQSI
jgi:hypothetical protein